jgi:transposase
MPINLYHTQRIRGFQQLKENCSPESLTVKLKRTRFYCRKCGSESLTTTAIRQRKVRGQPMGECRKVVFIFTIHRVYCKNCKYRSIENIHFLSHPKTRLTRSLERTVLELRQHMSIQAVANFFQLRWHSVKELEKRALKRKYSRIQTSHIKAIGIDEIYVSRSQDKGKYLTIIRDLGSGAVIHVGEGKGTEAIHGALRKLRKAKLKIVTMDMANAYYNWFARYFPKAKIVFDHFHVIKLMNEKIDKVRRRVVSKMGEVQKKQLKGLRFVFLKNYEHLEEDGKSILRNMRGDYQDLGDAYMFKESLRQIYIQAKTSYHARRAFARWCKAADKTEIPELKTMAKTIRSKIDGIVTYWTFSGISNASMEGFNNKIRWLIRQAYGFRDREYFKLKIFQLPEISSVREI